MSNTRSSSLKTALYAAITLLFVGTDAFALAPCDQVVVDTADKLTNIPAVEAAASALATATGAVVRVRITPDHAPQANLDQHVEVIIDTSCNSWNNINGDRRSNLLIFWVTMKNKQVGLYYGTVWDKELDRAWPIILEQKMKPFLRDENFNQAFIAAMEETARVIAAPQQSQERIISERDSVRVEQREPTDWTPVAIVLGVIVFLVFIFALLKFFLFPAFSQYSRIRGMHEEARGILSRCYQEFEHLDAYFKRLIEILGAIDKPASAPEWANAQVFSKWHHNLVLLRQTAEAVNTGFQTLESGTLSSARTYEEYRAVRDSMASYLLTFKKVNEDLAALEASIKEEESLSTTIESEVAVVATARTAVQSALLKAKTQGFRVDFTETLLNEAENHFGMGETYRSKKQYVLARDYYMQAITVFNKTKQMVEGLAERRDTLNTSLELLIQRQRKLLDHIPKVRYKLATLQARFAQNLFTMVRGNGTEAEQRLATIPEFVPQIGQRIDEQEFEQAESNLKSAHEVVDEAEALLDSISELEVQLEATAKDALEELAEAERSIGVVKKFLVDNPAYDSDHRKKMLDESLRLCDETRDELKKNKPDVVLAFKKASEADDHADEIFKLASTEKEHDDRQRERAERERRHALTEMQKLRKYHRNHHRDIKQKARRELDTAEQLATQLAEARDAEEVLNLVRQLETVRSSAYNTAKTDFNTAETLRKKSEPLSGGSTTWGDSSPSISLGGGSSGFSGDSSSGLGGGSSDW